MSTTLRRCGSLALAAAGVALLAACATTTAGTAAVAPNATPRSSAVTTTERTTETTTPTTTRTTPPSTTKSTTSSSTPAITVRPTDSAGAPATATSTLLFDGDCFDFAGSDVTTIDCAQLHDGQVFKSGVALTAVDPAETSADAWSKAANDACVTDFHTFVGSDQPDDYVQSFVITSETGGPPEVACTVLDTAGGKWAGTAESVSGSYVGIDVGDCFDYPTALLDAAELPCDQPHDAEMYVVDGPLGLDPPETPYPTEQQWQDLSTTVCLGAFADYTGQSYESALDLGYTFVYPLEPDWSDVTLRKMSCAVTSIDGTKLVGSKRA